MRVSPHLASLLLRSWLLLVLAGLGVTAAMATGAAWRALAEHAPAAAAIPAGYETQAHFPGAALLYLEEAPALPQPAGATGSVELPPVPVPAATALAIVAAEDSIVPARPFSMFAASGTDRARAMQCLTDAIYYEAASESDDGQRAVAQVILNRARHPVFPATVCGVVYQGSERASGCQFSFACDGAMARVPSRTGWARAMRNASAALNGQVFAPVGLATHYHTYAVTPAWNRTLVMTDAIGAHFFHRWKGYWGTALAFRQSYQGGEPAPGPHAKAIPPASPAPMLAAIALPMPVRVTPQTQIMPDHADSGTPIASATVRDDSQVLDRWKDSGKPLR